jgi:hypothetical protein
MPAPVSELLSIQEACAAVSDAPHSPAPPIFQTYRVDKARGTALDKDPGSEDFPNRMNLKAPQRCIDVLPVRQKQER